MTSTPTKESPSSTPANLVNEFTAAEILGVSVLTLRTWRSTRRVPLQWVKIGKSVRYRPESLQAYIESRVQGGEV